MAVMLTSQCYRRSIPRPRHHSETKTKTATLKPETQDKKLPQHCLEARLNQSCLSPEFL